MSTPRKLGSILLSAALIALTACGGGGGGGGLDVSAFSGTYWLADLGGLTETGPSRKVQSGWGTVTGDGVGGFGFEIWTNDNSAVDGPDSGTGTYTVQSDGQYAALATGSNMRGGIAADGGSVVLGQTEDDEAPLLAILLRRQGVFNDASLAGTHHFVGVEYHDFLDEIQVYSAGSFVLDDATGSYTASGGILNTDGVRSTYDSAFTHPYAVASDGKLDLEALTGVDLTGGVLEGGQVAVAGGSTTNGKNVILHVLLRVGSELSPASLSGPYWFVSLTHDGSRFRGATGTVTFDGAGGYAMSGTENVEGAVDPLSPDTGTYTLGDDGTLGLTRGGGDTLTGGVSPDARFFVLGGGTTNGNAPAFVFGMKK